jgi:hypothetical protein
MTQRPKLSDRLKAAAEEGRILRGEGAIRVIPSSPKPQPLLMDVPLPKSLAGKPPIPDELLAQWDRLSGAIDRTLTAQPWQLTEAANLLSEERLAFRTLIQKLAMGR